jgi:hypothetical protein
LLEVALRDGESLPAAFAESFRSAVETGALEVLVARAEDRWSVSPFSPTV